MAGPTGLEQPWPPPCGHTALRAGHGFRLSLRRGLRSPRLALAPAPPGRVFEPAFENAKGTGKTSALESFNGGADEARTRDLRRDRPSRAAGGVWKRLEREHIAFRLLSSGSVWKRRNGGY